jgi:hypothetical protein
MTKGSLIKSPGTSVHPCVPCGSRSSLALSQSFPNTGKTRPPLRKAHNLLTANLVGFGPYPQPTPREQVLSFEHFKQHHAVHRHLQLY